MLRNYESGKSKEVTFFTGKEVEHTPAHGMETLFVVGLQTIENIALKLTSGNGPINHIFFGANHSYNPQTYDEHRDWEKMIEFFLDKDYLCSLDIPIHQVEEFHETALCEYNNFIPQIRVPVPYTKLWNYNTMIKLDDIDFNRSTPGIWTHSLHSLMDRRVFTSWFEYNQDKIAK